ncbi:transmembrane protein, putative (macronuclear) [Tetrahymena thermophila SB210]|uniref:Transmembrane protein, putative n=1 Tax=Tetrahymena thermophila (strain SB210) TaxID=312017 RepID=Q23QQ8_TETTS|nr:transmembrane protein, putative [Tetrahymena thermophila SB210]EAR98830.2 transmembrane protein, putative [Tetrahymena thermophila SB210]|eukprot:XP_001019075.2 transmembrane protein, putative [Tetrahymena thermophila SB210]
MDNMYLNGQNMKEQQSKKEMDSYHEDQFNQNNLQLICSQSIPLESEKQNKYTFSDIVKYCIVGAMIGALIQEIFYLLIKQKFELVILGPVVGSFAPLIVMALKHYYQNQQQNRLSDYEKLVGINYFKEVNGRDYTKEEFDKKFNRSLLFEDPNKQPTKALAQNALLRQTKLKQAKVMVYKKYGWEE